ncbi:DNA polymerase III subunit gamma/tau [Patescibacteria group bacterium]|nr:DNA polymerase III subunit gamma/tau [Patescibacteria group bacterium]MDE1946967.1 DNA polymerase III subunit gamma/tau [Patescibacteria group bacterium]MDE2011240.1 DNA polymerase III subunit gamma/tau [Patescibacteria group bacterium]MDE2233404.1 DNA polymerase III subunit gamma/tau [Patescibacteria group bacterium]
MTVLYRTYRPKSFKEVIGQDHVVSALDGAIKNGKVAHAYLFSGSRGTGKTSVARIVAKELKVKDEDIYEIDAASNRGIDDIREIREHVSVRPFSSLYKVYIIDEVHMLTKEAFNALLKTLEEPPTHAIFILATTELHKVPETIVSRCQTFSFKKPPREVLCAMIIKVAKQEGYSLEPNAADLVALLGDGSFRDALGMLEKVTAMSADKKISFDEVSAIAGAPKAALVNGLVAALVGKDCAAALSAISAIEGHGISTGVFATLALEKLRFILLAEHGGLPENSKQRLSADDLDFVLAQSKKNLLSAASVAAFIRAAESVGRSPIESLPLELAAVEICG